MQWHGNYLTSPRWVGSPYGCREELVEKTPCMFQWGTYDILRMCGDAG